MQHYVKKLKSVSNVIKLIAINNVTFVNKYYLNKELSKSYYSSYFLDAKSCSSVYEMTLKTEILEYYKCFIA